MSERLYYADPSLAFFEAHVSDIREVSRSEGRSDVYKRQKPTSTVPADAAQLQLAGLYEKTNPAEANKIYALLKGSKSAAGQIAAQKLGQK